MPYLNIRIASSESSEIADKVVSILMKHTSELLGKKPEVTSIAVDFVKPELWYVGGQTIKSQNAITFYLDIKITDGTNTKGEKAKYIKMVFSDFEAIFGHIDPASYKKLPRKPRMLAVGMNWQNNFKKDLTNSKYDNILYM